MRVIDGNLGELFFRLFVPEGVQQGYATLEGFLHIGLAGNWEAYRAQLSGGQVFMVRVILIIVGCGSTGQNSKQGQRQRQNEQTPPDAFHSEPH